MIAKNLYVDTRSGWFSDRSACYLASGRPVLAQDTGLDGLLPAGEGLLTFSTLDEAVAGAEEISADYERHAGRRGRSPRSTSPPTGSCRGCSSAWGCDERGRRRRRAREQAGQRRRGMGAHELGTWASSGSASTSGSSSS